MGNSSQYIPGVAELGRKNQPNGYVGIDGSGDVLGTFAQRYDTAANIAAIVLKNGELAFTTDTQELFIGDGATAGGLFLWQKLQRQTKIGVDTLAGFAFVEPPDSGISIPLKANAIYRITMLIAFTGDTANQSNFKLGLYSGKTIFLSDTTEVWTQSGGTGNPKTIFDSKAINYPLSSASPSIDPTVDLTRASASLKLAGNFSQTEASNLIIAPQARVGSTSPAKASAVYEWRRIA